MRFHKTIILANFPGGAAETSESTSGLLSMERKVLSAPDSARSAAVQCVAGKQCRFKTPRFAESIRLLGRCCASAALEMCESEVVVAFRCAFQNSHVATGMFSASANEQYRIFSNIPKCSTRRFLSLPLTELFLSRFSSIA